MQQSAAAERRQVAIAAIGETRWAEFLRAYRRLKTAPTQPPGEPAERSEALADDINHVMNAWAAVVGSIEGGVVLNVIVRLAALGRSVGVVCVGLFACLGSGCYERIEQTQIRSILDREWSSTAGKCNLESAVNTFGTGTFLFCEFDQGETRAPTWLYSMGVAYTISDEARVLTPKLRSMAEADAEAFRLAGLDRGRFREQVASVIASQGK